jgi:hypothetical protein
MDLLVPRTGRRGFLGAAAAGLAGGLFWEVAGAFADELQKTPRLTEGPF